MTLVEIGEQKVYFDGYLLENLQRMREIVKKDFDNVFVTDGGEGVGKSVLTMQIGKFLDPSLSLDRVTFSADEFMQAVHAAQPEQCVIYDEAYTGMSSGDTMTKVNKVLTKLLAEVRQKRLIIIVTAPSFFDLTKYIALWRSRALIHCQLGGADGFERGYFSFYNAERKKNLYLLGKKLYNYKITRPNFYGRFTKKYVLDETEYRAKKLAALSKYKSVNSTAAEGISKGQSLFWELCGHLSRTKQMTYRQISMVLSNPRRVVTEDSISRGASWTAQKERVRTSLATESNSEEKKAEEEV